MLTCQDPGSKRHASSKSCNLGCESAWIRTGLAKKESSNIYIYIYIYIYIIIIIYKCVPARAPARINRPREDLATSAARAIYIYI